MGVSGGVEAAVHASRRFLVDMAPQKVMVKLDFNNAFNTVYRCHIIKAVSDQLPGDAAGGPFGSLAFLPVYPSPPGVLAF